MKVCSHKGLVVAVLMRNEHCPPHVHVGTARWDARFEFSFWHQGVRLWDVTPAQNEPSAPLLEELRQLIKQAPNLRRARELWWISRQTVCLDRQRWDEVAGAVVNAQHKATTRRITTAWFDARPYRTLLQLDGLPQPLEIEL